MATPLSSTIQRDGSASSFQGRRLNFPINVVLKSDSAIYFPQRTVGISPTRNSPRSLEEELEAMLDHRKTPTQKTHAAISANPSRQLYGNGRLLADLELRDLVSM